ncbi:hypothetical protein D3C81_1521780 [compost metagenome]
MLGVLFHFQVNVANRNLFIIFMLEHQHAVGNAQTRDVKRPSTVFGDIGQRIVFRGNGRIFATHRFGLRRQLNNSTFEHHLLHTELVAQQRP